MELREIILIFNDRRCTRASNNTMRSERCVKSCFLRSLIVLYISDILS